MQFNTPVYAAIFLTGFVLLSACNKPTPFAADLFDIADYKYTDTFTLRCTVIREDSIEIADRNSTTAFFLCGTLDDPFFGKTQSDIYSLLQLSDLGPDFEGAELDSAVLYLHYAASGFYGDTTQPQTLRVYGLSEQLDWDQDYYSNSTLAGSDEIGSLVNFYPKPRTRFNTFTTDTTATKAAYIGVRLSDAFGNFLLDIDSTHLATDTAFWQTLKGIKITASSGASPGAILAFNLNNDDFSFLRLYYHTAASDSLRFDYYFLGANKFTRFDHDYGNSDAGLAIGQPASDFLYAQGMAGLKIRVEIPYVDNLKNIVVNKAELELTAAARPGDNPLLEPANQLIFTESRGDTAFIVTSDVLYSLGSALTGDFSAFGGFPQTQPDPGTNEMVERYRLTLSQRLQQMIDESEGDIKKKTVYINVYTQGSSPMRSLLYGPQNAQYPAKLTLKYTHIK